MKKGDETNNALVSGVDIMLGLLNEDGESDIQAEDNTPMWHEHDDNNSLSDIQSIITYNCGCGGSSKSDVEEACKQITKVSTIVQILPTSQC